MKTSVERIDETTVKLSVTVEAQRVEAAIDAAARELASTAKVPGFRPGRVPRRVLESRLGKEAILAEALNDALPAFYSDAVAAEDLSVVGHPEFDVQRFRSGEDAEFTATVEVRPEITLPDYEGMVVQHPEWALTDEELDAQLDAMRERFAELETVQRPVDVGDYAVITITGERHGERVDDASGEDVLYQVHDPEQTGSALDREIVGASAGAVLKFTDTLGPDYGELAGQELSFTALVKEVKAKRLPPLDDDFAVTASEFDTLDELREALREQMAQQKASYAVAALRGVVVEQLAEQVEVAVPRTLVDHELRYRLSQLGRAAEEQGMGLDAYLAAAGSALDQVVPQLEEESRQTVKAQLVVDEVGRAAGIQVTQEDLGAEIGRQAMRLGRPPQELAEFMTHPDRIGALVADAYRRKAIDHLLASVTVEGAPPPEVLQPPAPPTGETGEEPVAAAGQPQEEGA